MDHPRDVIIIGAGLSGLVLAQGLKRRNVPFKLFEKHLKPEPTRSHPGYRFVISSTAWKCLQETVSSDVWRLIQDTHPKASPWTVPWLHARRGTIMRDGENDHAEMRYPLDRFWIRQLLGIGLEKTVEYGKGFSSYELLENGVKVHFDDGTSCVGKMVIGADGMRSQVRKQLLPDARSLDLERVVFWGRSPLTPELELKYGREEILKKHLAIAVDEQRPERAMIYSRILWPLGGKLSERDPGLSDQTDYVFFTLTAEVQPGPVSMETPDDRLNWSLGVTKGWCDHLRTIIRNQETTSVVHIYSEAPQLPTWPSDFRTTLLGDSMHAMSPCSGAGAATAIRDAHALALALGTAWNGTGEWDQASLSGTISDFETFMRRIGAEAVELGFKNGMAIWAGKDWSQYQSVVL